MQCGGRQKEGFHSVGTEIPEYEDYKTNSRADGYATNMSPAYLHRFAS